MICYLAVPYSHSSPSVMYLRYLAANKVAAVLMQEGECVFSPISHSVPIAEYLPETTNNWSYWERMDLPILRLCSKVYVLMAPGWDKSVGVTGEVAEAERLGLPVEYIGWREYGASLSRKLIPGYSSWKNMHQRCYNAAHPRYKDWGGRGIAVCDEWHDYDNFLSDMGIKPDGKSLDRIDNDLGYSASNCRWSTPAEQNRNQRRRRDAVIISGLTASEWSDLTGLDYKTIMNRWRLGWTIEEIINGERERHPGPGEA